MDRFVGALRDHKALHGALEELDEGFAVSLRGVHQISRDGSSLNFQTADGMARVFDSDIGLRRTP